MKKYIFKKQFDIYTCHEGRTTVNPDAECVLVERSGFKRIYFVNSHNFLPSVATNSLLYEGMDEYTNEVMEFKRCTLKDNEIKNDISHELLVQGDQL